MPIMNTWPLPQEVFGANRDTRLLQEVTQEEQDQEIVLIATTLVTSLPSAHMRIEERMVGDLFSRTSPSLHPPSTTQRRTMSPLIYANPSRRTTQQEKANNQFVGS